MENDMKQMHADVAMPEASITQVMNEWIDANMPIDIEVKRGEHNGQKMVAFYIYGSTQEDIIAKCEALGKLLNK